MNYGLHLRPRPINRDMQRQLGWRSWGFFRDLAVRSDDHKILLPDRAPDRTPGIDQNVSVVETDTEMAVEIDDTQTFQDRNTMGKFVPERYFTSRIRSHGSQCPPALQQQPAADDDGGTPDKSSGGRIEPARKPLQQPQRIGGNERQRGHAGDRTHGKCKDLSDRIHQRVGGCREYEQSGRPCRTVTHANHKGAAETQIVMVMLASALRVWRHIVVVSMGVYVAHPAFVLMNVEMRTLPPKSAQNIGTQ